MRSLTTGTALNDSCDTGCTGIRSEKQLCTALDRNEAVNVPQSRVAAVLCLSHTGPAEQNRAARSHSC